MKKKIKPVNHKKGKYMKAPNLVTKLREPKILKLTIFVFIFGVVGAIMLFRSFAAGSSTISGYAFQDTNRNGVMDTGELPWANHQLYLFDSSFTIYKGTVVTDSTGRYIFNNLEDGDYMVAYAATTLTNEPTRLKYEWIPTTTGSLKSQVLVNLNGSATANFGWRKVAKSTDPNQPFSTYTTASGLRISVYVDAITAQDVYNELIKGSLVGIEGKSIHVSIGYPNPDGNSYNATANGWQTSNGACTSFSSRSNTTWGTWISNLDGQGTLFHEYGHAWSGYYACMVQNDNTHTGYLKARSLYGDSRINSDYTWSVHEMIAEDYRQLFGEPGAAARDQANRNIPRAADVPGLKEYLSTTFLQAPSSGAPPPISSALTATASLSEEGPMVSLNWGASTGAVTYDVYRNGFKIGFTNAPGTTYVDINNLSYSTSYSYYIKPVNGSGVSGTASNTVNVVTPSSDNTKPSAPTSLTSPTQTQTSITLKWSASSDNVGVVAYRVYRIGGSRKNQTTTLVDSPTGTSYTVTGLSRATSYSFYVTAIDAAGNESPTSNTLTVKTKR